jgi:asparagine synthase (glutamine-hydrolysing)
MCGICGIYNFDNSHVKKENLLILNNEMIERGPDSSGLYVKKNFGFAMRRLFIIDKITGDQPIFSDDKNISLIFNGEIYNYIEIRDQLKSQGIKFQSKSDTEVILKLYEMEGEDFVKKLNGMFSICLYDLKKDKILIYRDRLGIKPLYYFKNEEQFIFSSSLSSIKKLKPNISPSKESCLLFYLFNYFPDSKTAYDGVFKLKPGNLIIINNGKFSIKEYWKLKKNNTIKYEDSKKEILNLLVNSVKINLRSDVPIATLLSGGMDSSILAFLISKETNLQQTLSVDYIGKKFNEGENAKLFSNKIGSIHTSVKLDQEKFFSIFREIFSKIDEPNADSALISSFALAREAKKKGIKVLISGSGADEIFGGYSRYFSSLRNNIYGIFQSKKTDSNILKIIPYKYKDYFYKLANSKISLACNQSGQSFSLIIKLFKDKNSKDFLLNYLESLFQNFKEDFFKFSSITVMQNDLKTYLPDNILSGFDKATMLNSVEGRVPYLDHRIVETFYSTNLDHNYFNDFSKNKKIIRDLFEMEILDKVFKRKKIGFDAPLVEWNLENSNYYKNDKNKNSILTENLDLDFIDRNIDNTNLNQLVYTTNVYNNWLNSL